MFRKNTKHQQPALISAATTNVRHIVPMSFGRIQRYLTAKMKQAEVAKSLQSEAVSVAVASFFVFRRTGCAPG